MASESTKQSILRELERAHPGPVTGRSLVSLVSDGSRKTVEQSLSELVVEGRVERQREKGLTRYRLKG